MGKQELQNKNFDRIGRRLLKTTRMSNEEIEKIVTSPQLFDSIKARIKVEEQARRKPKRFLIDSATILIWNRQGIVGACAILIVFLSCLFVVINKKQDSPELVEQTVNLQTPQQISQIQNPVPNGESRKEKKIQTVNNRVNSEPIVFKTETSKLTNQVQKAKPVKLVHPNKKQPQEVFYSLASAGNWETNGEDLQIVRAEISTSELSALGLNLPVENEAAKIKTDLLVGADGVPRAIRFVE